MSKIEIKLKDADYTQPVGRNNKVTWKNDTTDCVINLTIPECAEPKEPGPIELQPGAETHEYKIKNQDGQWTHSFSVNCPVGVPNPRTGTIDVSQ